MHSNSGFQESIVPSYFPLTNINAVLILMHHGHDCLQTPM